MTNNAFGFENEEVLGQRPVHCQLFNPVSSPEWGLGLTVAQAEKADFIPSDRFQLIKGYEFSEGKADIYLSKKPKLLILNTYLNNLFMVKRDEEKPIVEKFDRRVFNKTTHKALSYIAVLFLGENNKPLSELPFRLKLSTQSANMLRDFCIGGFNCPNDNLFNHLFSQYKKATGKKGEPASFKAHMIYEPVLEKGKLSNGKNSANVCLTTGFAKYPLEKGLIHRSQHILDMIELSKDWGTAKQVLKEETVAQVDPLATLTDSNGEVHDPELEAHLATLDLF